VSEQSVGAVLRAYEVWNERGPAAIGPLVTDDVELHDAPQLPDAQVWRGRDAVLERLAAVAASVGGGSVEFEGFRDTGEEVVIAMCWRLGSERGEAQLGRVFHVVRVTDGLISRIRVFLTEAEARDPP
jgi:ketosteroid isomerase-like protein